MFSVLLRVGKIYRFGRCFYLFHAFDHPIHQVQIQNRCHWNLKAQALLYSFFSSLPLSLISERKDVNMDKDKSKVSFPVSESMIIVRLKERFNDSFYLLDEIKTIVDRVEGEDRSIPVCSLPRVEDPSGISDPDFVGSSLGTILFNIREEEGYSGESSDGEYSRCHPRGNSIR